jgi:hypothetical protein
MNGLPALYYLKCITPGTTAAVTPVIPANVQIGDTITDGTVVWQVIAAVTDEDLASTNLALAESTGFGIISGCEPTISGLTVTVGTGVVHLADGTRKELSATNVTLDAADSTNPRIDLVYIDSTGAVAKITGTAAASPSAPSVPANGVSVAQVSVAANAVTGTVTDSRGMLARWYHTSIVSVDDFEGASYSEKLQNAINNVTDGGIIILTKGTINNTVNLPIDKSISFVSSATVTVSASVGFLRTTPTVDGITSTIVFDNINFIDSTNDSVCIKDKVKFFNGGNRGIKVTNCTFELSGSSVGVELTGSMFNYISHNTFTMSANCIGVCLKGDTADVYRWAMNSSISDNTFKGGHSIKSELSTGLSFEGLNVLNNEFFTSPIELDNISLVNISCNTFISSPLYITSVFDAHINNNYFDTAEKGLPLISMSNTSSNYLWSVTIEGNHFSRYGYGGNCVEINGDSSNICQNISFVGNSYNGIGSINSGTVDPTDPTERMFGIVNNNPGAKNILIAEENFNHLYSAITLNEQISYSTINRFEANDTKYYLINPGNAVLYSRIDNLYKVIPVDIMVPYYTLGNTTDVIFNENYDYDTMLATPSVTFTPSYQSSNITYTVSSSDKNTKITIRKTASETATGDWPRASLAGTLILDATQNTHR